MSSTFFLLLMFFVLRRYAHRIILSQKKSAIFLYRHMDIDMDLVAGRGQLLTFCSCWSSVLYWNKVWKSNHVAPRVIMNTTTSNTTIFPFAFTEYCEHL